MLLRRSVRLLMTMTVTAILLLVAGLFTTPAQAADAQASAPKGSAESRTKSARITGKADQIAMREAGETRGGVVAQVIPGAYRICGAYKCIWVESSKYCPPTTGCGAKAILGPWPGGYCAPSTGCVTLPNGSRHKVYAPYVYDDGHAGRVARCAASVGLGVVGFWTRGYSHLALAGAGITAWGCSTI